MLAQVRAGAACSNVDVEWDGTYFASALSPQCQPPRLMAMVMKKDKAPLEFM